MAADATGAGARRREFGLDLDCLSLETRQRGMIYGVGKVQAKGVKGEKNQARVEDSRLIK